MKRPVRSSSEISMTFAPKKSSPAGAAPMNPGPSVRGGNAAFTMVEIALCLGVIAFALVAIIGVLPTGVRVQRDNREDTIINQEGLLWLEAIRSGAQGLDYLTNYVDTITISNSSPAVAVFASPEARKNIPGAGLLTNGYQI